MIEPQEWGFGYADLAEATGLEPGAVRQHRVRGYFDPEKIETVAVYLARYGSDKLKREIIDAIIWRQVPDDPGGWKKKGRRKG